MAFQFLGYVPPPRPNVGPEGTEQDNPLFFSASTLTLGSGPDEGFIFDNEKWRHPVRLPAFAIDANPVTEQRFATFIDAGGYHNPSLWSVAGWAWRTSNEITHPLYWQQKNGNWQVRRFECWTPLRHASAMLHVSYFEAEAFAQWAQRQLPSASQWLAASASPAFRWGMAWEWLRDPFVPYPDFQTDPYRDYSQPWFHSHQELRGAGPVTDRQLRRPGLRNFYLPHRRDPFTGFRTARQTDAAT